MIKLRICVSKQQSARGSHPVYSLPKAYTKIHSSVILPYILQDVDSFYKKNCPAFLSHFRKNLQLKRKYGTMIALQINRSKDAFITPYFLNLIASEKRSISAYNGGISWIICNFRRHAAALSITNARGTALAHYPKRPCTLYSNGILSQTSPFMR